MKIKTLKQAKDLRLKTYSHPNGEWEYMDAEGYWHLFVNGEEILPEIKKWAIHSYLNGDWKYQDINNKWHLIKGYNNEE